MTRTATLQAELDVIPGTILSPRTVVALPPSTLDPIWDEMRVVIDGVTVISRAIDPGAAVVTGAPIPYVTKAAEEYVTKTGEPYVTRVAT